MPKLVQRTSIHAPLETVYKVVADVNRYPEFLPGVLLVNLDGDLVEMTVQAGPLQLTWVHRAAFKPFQEISTTLVRGPFRRLDGRWKFTEDGEHVKAVYENEWELDLPIPGASFIVSRALESNLTKTLQAFKKRIHALEPHA